MDPDSVLKEVEADMKAAIEHLNKEFSSVRTGKASPALVDSLSTPAPLVILKKRFVKGIQGSILFLTERFFVCRFLN